MRVTILQVCLIVNSTQIQVWQFTRVLMLNLTKLCRRCSDCCQCLNGAVTQSNGINDDTLPCSLHPTPCSQLSPSWSLLSSPFSLHPFPFILLPSPSTLLSSLPPSLSTLLPASFSLIHPSMRRWRITVHVIDGCDRCFISSRLQARDECRERLSRAFLMSLTGPQCNTHLVCVALP